MSFGQFLTILNPVRAEYKATMNQGGLGYYFHDFEYELYDDPATEAISIGFGPQLARCLPREFWPDVESGASRGAVEARNHGLRLCCVRFTLLRAKYHDVDTNSHVIQRKVADCVHAHVALRFAELMTPLPNDWLSSDVIALARGIHANAAFDGLPALHDALLEAGCDDPLVIEHLRACTDHSPSCWVVEMILDQWTERSARELPTPPKRSK